MPWYYQVVIIGTLSLALVLGAKSWHNQVVQSAVTSAVLQNTQEINSKYTDKLNDLKLQQEINQKVLDNKTKDTLKEKQNALQASTNKYNDLLEWVRAQPSSTTNDTSSESNILGYPRDSESTGSILNNGLLRKDAIDLAEYAQRTQELKVYLNSCYRQYDEVKGTVDAFTKKHNGTENTNNLINTKE